MIPVMCNCANNKIGVCYGDVNVIKIQRTMQVQSPDGRSFTTPAGTEMFDAKGEITTSTACPGYIPIGSAPFRGVEQGGVWINQDSRVSLTAPTGLTSPSKTTTTVNLSWTGAMSSSDNVGITGYDIYNGATLAGSTTGAITYQVTGLTANTAYSFTVKAKDALGNVSVASSALSVTTAAA